MNSSSVPITIQRKILLKTYCSVENYRDSVTNLNMYRYPLNFVDETGATDPTFNLEKLSPATYQVQIQLPPHVLQWTYVTGNRWGVCPDGSSRLGCGPQESFRASDNDGGSHFGCNRSSNYIFNINPDRRNPPDNDPGNGNHLR